MRPNIKIEIRNNLVEEKMDVDEDEEGEVIEESEEDDDQDTAATPAALPRVNNDTAPKILRNTFITGVDIPSKEDKLKLQERAKRFQLKPEEIQNFTEEELQHLHGSLGITSDKDPNVRFEAVHVLGVKGMNTEDILDYFLKYAPHSLEWISDDSCNVVWRDRLSSARALHFLSKPVKDMPVRSDLTYFEEPVPEPVQNEDNTSILLINKNREVELKHDMDSLPLSNKIVYPNSAELSEITVSIPPGFWRLGASHPKAKCLLMRFSLKTDRLPFKTDELSKFHKKVATVTAAAAKLEPLISRSARNKAAQSIFGRNKDLKNAKESGDNPWSILAKNWDEDARFREQEPVLIVDEPMVKVEVKNPNLRTRLGAKKRPKSESESSEKKDDDQDDEEEELEQPRKKVKIPRMRMYADEEEERIKRQRALKTIKQQMEKIATKADDDRRKGNDLRHVLSTTRHRTLKDCDAEKQAKSQASVDLGSMLKNRTRTMVFEVKTEKTSDRLQERSSSSYRTTSRERRDSREDRPRYRRSPVTFDSRRRQDGYRDRSRSRTRRHRHHDSDDDRIHDYGNKPKSKVAIVVKTQKRPVVASAIRTRIGRRISKSDDSEESESDSSDSSSSSSSSSSASSSSTNSESEADETVVTTATDPEEIVTYGKKAVNRPGFDDSQKDDVRSRRAEIIKNPLKIEISNDHFKKT